MGSIEARLRKLEGGRAAPGEGWVTPPEVRVYTKAVEHFQARKNGEDPPPYSPEEITELRRDDLAAAAGGGVVGEYRGSRGWDSPKGQATLDEWEESARHRVEAMADLPPEQWGEVYEHDEEELHDER